MTSFTAGWNEGEVSTKFAPPATASPPRSLPSHAVVALVSVRALMSNPPVSLIAAALAEPSHAMSSCGSSL